MCRVRFSMTDMMESTELDSAITLAAVLRRRAEAAEVERKGEEDD